MHIARQSTSGMTKRLSTMRTVQEHRLRKSMRRWRSDNAPQGTVCNSASPHTANTQLRWIQSTASTSQRHSFRTTLTLWLRQSPRRCPQGNGHSLDCLRRPRTSQPRTPCTLQTTPHPQLPSSSLEGTMCKIQSYHTCLLYSSHGSCTELRPLQRRAQRSTCENRLLNPRYTRPRQSLTCPGSWTYARRRLAPHRWTIARCRFEPHP
jgi:hypothetical protein